MFKYLQPPLSIFLLSHDSSIYSIKKQSSHSQKLNLIKNRHFIQYIIFVIASNTYCYHGTLEIIAQELETLVCLIIGKKLNTVCSKILVRFAHQTKTVVQDRTVCAAN